MSENPVHVAEHTGRTRRPGGKSDVEAGLRRLVQRASGVSVRPRDARSSVRCQLSRQRASRLALRFSTLAYRRTARDHHDRFARPRCPARHRVRSQTVGDHGRRSSPRCEARPAGCLGVCSRMDHCDLRDDGRNTGRLRCALRFRERCAQDYLCLGAGACPAHARIRRPPDAEGSA